MRYRIWSNLIVFHGRKRPKAWPKTVCVRILLKIVGKLAVKNANRGLDESLRIGENGVPVSSFSAEKILIVLTSALLVGCGAAQRTSCPVPEQGAIVFHGSDRQNPDDRGRSLPTVVRVFQLSSIGELERASFQDLWRTPESSLGETLIGMEEVTVYPERRLSWPFERDDSARFLVAMAVVRRPIGESWRSIIELPTPSSVTSCGQVVDEEAPPPASTPHLDVYLSDYSVRAELEMQSQRRCESGTCLGDVLDSAAEETGVDAPDAPETPETPTLEVP